MNTLALLVLSGLWQIKFSDGTSLDETVCTVQTNAPGVVAYAAPDADVVIAARAGADGLELRGRVTPHGGKTVTDFLLPARVRFNPDDVARVTFPGDKSFGAGYSLKPDFFRRQTDLRTCAWEGVAVKGCGYRSVFDGGCVMRPLKEAPVAVTATPDGAAFLDADALAVVTNALYAVNRAPLPGAYDRALVDSPHGPLLSGSSLGGTGTLWRVGAASSADDAKARLALLRGLLGGVLRAAPPDGARRRVAFIRFPAGPKHITFCKATLEEVRRTVQGVCTGRFAYTELTTPAAIAAAEAAPDTLLIVNPYAETLPAESVADFPAALARVKDYVRGGGQWLEVAGLSFHKALVPREWMTLGGDYPGLFADFVHWRGADGTTCALMGVQPRPAHAPWRCPRPFVPGTLRIGGDAEGGWVEHGFRAWVKDGETWTTPTVLITTNRSLAATCDDYVRLNTLGRPLADKVRDPAKLETLKRAPLLFLGDGAAKGRAAVPNIPVPSLVHQSQYLRGGFDKQYPDHLPPRESYGTAEEMRALIDDLHAAGHLYSPYTNPTWWCDHPRGPTFAAAGEAPVSVNAKGEKHHESYGAPDGWTVCFWHPAVQTANRATRRAFTQDFPVDLLFQDQCGARHLPYDFNPAAPHPTAYLEGMLSMVEEDAQVVPLATEDGWDRVAAEETALCGLSWRMVPIEDDDRASHILEKTAVPAHLWEIEAVPGRLFHGTCLFYLHDLAGFVRNERTLAWCLALGYQLSFRCNAWHFTHDEGTRAWYARLHGLQQDIVARYAGRKLLRFRHDRAPLLARGDIEPASRADDGTVVAEYEGGLRLAVNLGDVPRTVAGHPLPPYGFICIRAREMR